MESRQLRVWTFSQFGIEELSHRYTSVSQRYQGAKMSARGREDGRGVVVKYRSVIGRTRQRFARSGWMENAEKLEGANAIDDSAMLLGRLPS